MAKVDILGSVGSKAPLLIPPQMMRRIQRSLAYATSCRNPYYRAAWRYERRLWQPLRLFPGSTNGPASTLLLPQQPADGKLRNPPQCEHLQLHRSWRSALRQPRTAPESQTIPAALVSNMCSSNPAANPAPLPPEFHQACV